MTRAQLSAEMAGEEINRPEAGPMAIGDPGMPSLKEPRPYDVFQAGTILNNTYEIKGVLGRGGTGEVYLAQHQIVEREMAIKVLNSVFSGNDDYLELMKREEQMRMIVHDAVVRYNECSRTDQGHVYLVMDFIDGPSLHDLMSERKMSADELLVIARRVLEGLVATHAQGVVHRDLSPDNIILREGRPDKATIIDFGIAKDTSAGARTIVGNDFAGKYEYAAPEQLDGEATARSDLYALGASLLAAFRKEIPNVGTSPGEVYRTKQLALDLTGVPSELQDFIAWLTAPDPEARPQSAAEALDRLGNVPTGSRVASDTSAPTVIAKPKKAAASKPDTVPGTGSGGKIFAVLAGVILVTGLGVGVWYSDLLSQKPPLISPYVFSASFDESGADLTGNAPSSEAAAALASAFGAVSGSSVEATALTVARGTPSELWPEQTAALLGLLSPLETWSVSLEDNTGILSGFSSDVLVRDDVIASVESWANSSRVSMSYDLSAGPRILTSEELQAALDVIGTCGRLSHLAGPGSTYTMSDSITIVGDLAKPRDADTMRLALSEIVGDRVLDFNTTFLNDDLCAIRSVLPPMTSDFDIKLTDGATGAVSEDGIFRTDQNPVVDVVLPATLDDGWLWVMVVDNTGKVFHVLPNAMDSEQLVPNLGQIEGDMRRIRVLWSIAEVQQNTQRLAIEVTEGDYGKSEIIAIMSRGPLFELRRPRDENIVSVAEALSERLAGRDNLIIGMASRAIDARP